MSLQITDRSILQKYIVDGKIDYSTLKSDDELNKHLDTMSTINLDTFNTQEEFAFWLNAYNLFTLKAVLNELANNPEWTGVTSLWGKLRFFYLNKYLIAGKKISLYNLENKILRKRFRDPRIHFAINCASISCPYLPTNLFIAENLDEYLDELTNDFINNQNSVVVSGDSMRISRIFKWYKKDFDASGGTIEFIKKYWKGEPFQDGIKIDYLDYNWGVNKQL